MRPNASVRESGRPRAERRALAGVTLAEAIIAMAIFALVASGLTASIIQMRRQGERQITEASAQAVAESIIEQVRGTSFANLSIVDDEDAGTAAPPLELKFIDVGSDNFATIQTFDLSWAANRTTFTEIGARVNPSDNTSAVLGIVADMEYRHSVTNAVIRPKRYMKMSVNLTKQVDAGNGRITVALQYQWAIPDRKTNVGGPVYTQPREIRTLISKISTY